MFRAGLSVLFVVALAALSSDALVCGGAAPKHAYKGKPVGRMVHYSGQVQGVGFRAATEQIARDYPVTGWVKNLQDGRVQLLVEGPDDAVRDFLEAVRKRWPDNIKKVEVEERPVSGQYKTFKVAF